MKLIPHGCSHCNGDLMDSEDGDGFICLMCNRPKEAITIPLDVLKELGEEPEPRSRARKATAKGLA